MIKVTRLNGASLVINADLIEFVEAIPETIVCLTTGKKIMVKEAIDDIISRVAEFKQMSGVRVKNPDTTPLTKEMDHGER
ncbi:MAG: flagellar FlbD family protein [candidate division Zixibacteria bacterium]|nr:flagellar FlbD family protein [candidate division Zixibacteria bacterium]